MKSATYQIPIPWQNEKPCLHRMIRQIQTRPGMYLGSNTLTPLSHFLDGYRTAERDLDVCWHGNLFPLDFQFMHVEMKRYWKAILTKENIERNNKMERCYAMKGHGAEPVYKNPIAVYVLELTIPSYMLIVETANEVHAETQFFSSAEEAKGNGCIPNGAEAYFGEIKQRTSHDLPRSVTKNIICIVRNYHASIFFNNV